MPHCNDSGKSTHKLSLLVLAAGMGSRFGGLKQISPVGPCGEAVLDYSVFDAIRAGFKRVVFVIRKDFEEQFRQSVGKRFEKHVEVEYAFQDLNDLPAPFTLPEGRTKPWGTAHAVLAARSLVNGPFAVINADDFYGAGAYREIAAFLNNAREDTGKPAPFCMVAYELGRTLSEHGTVSRGVCKVDECGCLVSIQEMEKIRQSPSGPEALNADIWTKIPANTPVSMNIMGFTPSLIKMLEERFRLFLEQRIGVPGAECYLPESVSFAIASGRASLRVLRSSDEWMGITYPQDRDSFIAKINTLHGKGEYPSPLWPEN